MVLQQPASVEVSSDGSIGTFHAGPSFEQLDAKLLHTVEQVATPEAAWQGHGTPVKEEAKQPEQPEPEHGTGSPELTNPDNASPSLWGGYFGGMQDRETFFRGWAELMASDGETAILLDLDKEVTIMEKEAHRIAPSPGWFPHELKAHQMAGLSGCVGGYFLLLWWYASNRKTDGLERGKRSLGELTGICCFRFYSGVLMCTWLPFLLAEEGAALMPGHQSVFMGCGKLILAIAMILCPVFGLLNDLTVNSLGRRRVWFLGGIALLFAGILGCAYASMLKMPMVYMGATLFWCIGEAVAESSTEALIPDLVSTDEYLQAASARGVLFMLGGFCGYGAIILQATVLRAPASVFYLYYIVVIALTAPFVVNLSTPTLAEQKVIEEHREREQARQPLVNDDPGGGLVPGDAEAVSDIEAAERSKSYWQRCYVECFNASPEFRIVSIATFFLAMSTTGMMFVLLIVRDVVGVNDAAAIEYHMAAGSLVLLSTATAVSVLIGIIGIDAANQPLVLGVFLCTFTLTEFGMMGTPLVPTQHGRLVYLYAIGAVKGMAFGGIYNIMQPVTWDAIPEMWRSGVGSISRAMSWVSVCRSVGVGVGNFIAGFILDFAKQHSAEKLDNNRYPVSGYVALFCFTGSCSVVTIILTGKFLAMRKPHMDRSAIPTGGSAQ